MYVSTTILSFLMTNKFIYIHFNFHCVWLISIGNKSNHTKTMSIVDRCYLSNDLNSKIIVCVPCLSRRNIAKNKRIKGWIRLFIKIRRFWMWIQVSFMVVIISISNQFIKIAYTKRFQSKIIIGLTVIIYK